MRGGPQPLALGSAAVVVAGSAGLTAAAAAALRRRPPGGAARWERTNHAGNPVSLIEGPALIAGAAGSALGAGAVGLDPTPAVIAVVGPGVAGLADDQARDGDNKGLRGHLGALRRGTLTTGAIKIAVLGASGLLAADRLRPDDTRGMARLTAAVLGGGVIAGSANLANLLDLRPGRALKATTIAAGMLAIRPNRTLPAAIALGTSLALLPDDLAGRTMLGDGGSNPAGALVGTALVAQTGTRGRLTALAVLTALTLASEKVSFSRIITTTPGLRELDAWGRA